MENELDPVDHMFHNTTVPSSSMRHVDASTLCLHTCMCVPFYVVRYYLCLLLQTVKQSKRKFYLLLVLRQCNNAIIIIALSLSGHNNDHDKWCYILKIYIFIVHHRYILYIVSMIPDQKFINEIKFTIMPFVLQKLIECATFSRLYVLRNAFFIYWPNANSMNHAIGNCVCACKFVCAFLYDIYSHER